MSEPLLKDLLVNHRSRLIEIVRRKAGAPLLRFESAEDLVQGIHLEALQSDKSFRYQGEGSFMAWLDLVSTRYLTARRNHWFALKRQGGQFWRLSRAEELPGWEALDSAQGPKTLAERREQMVILAKAISFLRERDQNLVQWASEGLSAAEIAQRLETSHASAEKARSRAFERLRKAYEIAQRFQTD